jgi:hypothetical protein
MKESIRGCRKMEESMVKSCQSKVLRADYLRTLSEDGRFYGQRYAKYVYINIRIRRCRKI